MLERLHARFNDREAHTHLPLPIARFRDEARDEIFDLAKRFDDVRTEQVEEGPGDDETANSPAEAMAIYARHYNADVDAMMAVLVAPARYRKGHYAYGKFTVPAPHGLHTDHSAEDSTARGEPICIARIETLGTHYVAGDYQAGDAQEHPGRLRHADGRGKRFGRCPGHAAHRGPSASRRSALGVFPETVQASGGCRTMMPCQSNRLANRCLIWSAM